MGKEKSGNKNGKMTLDKLGRMVADGFGEMRGEMNEMRGEMNEMKGEMNEMRGTMATKEELMAVKKELMATMATMATKEELRKMATKEELRTGFRELDQRIDRVEQKLHKVDFRVEEMHEILTRFEESDILDLQKRTKILERSVRAISKQLG